MTQQRKVRQGGPKPCHCSNQRGSIFKCRAELGFLGVLVEIDLDCVFKISKEFELEATPQKSL